MSDPHQPPRPDFSKEPRDQRADQRPDQHAGQPWPGARPPHPPPAAAQHSPHGLAPMSVQDERTWSVLAHVGTLLLWFGLPVLAPLVVFLVFKDRSPFVREHAAEALNASLSTLIYGTALGTLGGVVILVTFGAIAPLLLLALGALVVATTVFAILAAVAANSGRPYRYPLVLRLVR